jgi:hypothetical protein
MMRPEVMPRRSDESQQAPNDHHRVKARALPIAAPEVEPEIELIERQRQTDPVHRGNASKDPSVRTRQQQVRADCRQQEDAVVQVMDMSAAQMQVEVRNAAGHD